MDKREINKQDLELCKVFCKKDHHVMDKVYVSPTAMVATNGRILTALGDWETRDGYVLVQPEELLECFRKGGSDIGTLEAGKFITTTAQGKESVTEVECSVADYPDFRRVIELIPRDPGTSLVDTAYLTQALTALKKYKTPSIKITTAGTGPVRIEAEGLLVLAMPRGVA